MIFSSIIVLICRAKTPESEWRGSRDREENLGEGTCTGESRGEETRGEGTCEEETQREETRREETRGEETRGEPEGTCTGESRGEEISRVEGEETRVERKNPPASSWLVITC